MQSDTAEKAGIAELVEMLAQGRSAAALARGRELVRARPRSAELWRLLGIAALQTGNAAAAEDALETALRIEPDSVDVLCNLASVHSAAGAVERAEHLLRRALALAPGHAAALNNLGGLLAARGDQEAAADCFAEAVRHRPGYVRAWLNHAAALLALCRHDAAELSARQALALAPASPDAYFLLGNVLGAARRLDAAAAAWREAARLAPNEARNHYQLGLALDDLGDFAGAIAAYERALQCDGAYWPALSKLVFLKRRICDWRGLAGLSQRMLAGVGRGAEGITPFSFLVEDATPAQQLACARRFAALHAVRSDPRGDGGATPTPRANSPLRVGFVSSGFGEHPTALLIAELIERLRDSPLRTIAFATTPDDGGPLRARLAAAFHEFHDVSAKPLAAMDAAVRDARIDVLIDLDGYCQDSHPRLFARRAAPLQVNWLAYPGSLGAPWYDYLIADAFLIPDAQRAWYDEKIARLPRCYQPTDTTRRSAAPGTRDDHGLPADGVVFASFNNSWKFTERSFARWMRILERVPDSVLWLLSGPSGSGTDARLRDAAQTAGIDPRRLVFAPHAPHDRHLARYAHADLFLDTHPYNAHTTASDAAWGGCPVLTAPGDTFASRVAGSINHALGLDELNVESDEAYIDLAVRLAGDRDRLRGLRAQVERARRDSGLFDMAGYARDFTALLGAMAARRAAGCDPADIAVDSTP